MSDQHREERQRAVRAFVEQVRNKLLAAYECKILELGITVQEADARFGIDSSLFDRAADPNLERLAALTLPEVVGIGIAIGWRLSISARDPDCCEEPHGDAGA